MSSQADDPVVQAAVAALVNDRGGLLRRIFGLVVAQVWIVAAEVAPVIFVEDVRRFFASHMLVICLVCLFVGVFSYLAIVFSPQSPANRTRFALFTVAAATILTAWCATVSARAKAEWFLQAFIVTMIIVIGVVMWSLSSQPNSERVVLWIMVVLIAYASSIIVSVLYRVPGVRVICAVSGAVLFLLLLCQDVWRAKQFFASDEHIAGATVIFTDMALVLVNITFLGL
ncbi:Inhibitor of apoptosis-promoting Bax1 [Plasmodiophora brassicae]|uniref:Uncharacterized protein n=1 Tax=Plasmodiophora brassicae TaxID=37360 RepID=A0A0G4INE4_PLABS|nr:hypothetical protein PBRA_005312 [Plasmodiophora brassicae]